MAATRRPRGRRPRARAARGCRRRSARPSSGAAARARGRPRAASARHAASLRSAARRCGARARPGASSSAVSRGPSVAHPHRRRRRRRPRRRRGRPRRRSRHRASASSDPGRAAAPGIRSARSIPAIAALEQPRPPPRAGRRGAGSAAASQVVGPLAEAGQAALGAPRARRRRAARSPPRLGPCARASCPRRPRRSPGPRAGGRRGAPVSRASRTSAQTALAVSLGEGQLGLDVGPEVAGRRTLRHAASAALWAARASPSRPRSRRAAIR